MRRRSLLLLCLTVVGVLLTVLRWPHAPAADADQPAISVPGELPPPKWMGAASCAAAACHGGDGHKDPWRNEFATWLSGDKQHAQAYAALFKEKSKQIARLLGRKVKPHQDTLCLNCHVHQGYDRERHQLDFSPTFGVSCESCHGAAQHWLAEHYKPGLSREQKQQLGMTDTKNLVGRAKTCVACHVGAPGQEVNHDLIAAGHPPLRFEFGSYHALMPRHWERRKDLARYPDLEARAWTVGQVVSAQAALKLLAHRADDSDNNGQKSVWPEFAAYDCSACHQYLKADGGRKKLPDGNVGIGLAPWNSWYFAMLPRTANFGDETGSKATSAKLEELRAALEAKWPHRPKVSEKVRALLKTLDGLPEHLEQRAGTTREVMERFRHLADEDFGKRRASWDEATQHYLALAAHHHAWKELEPRRTPPGLRPSLEGLAKFLEMPRSLGGDDLDHWKGSLQSICKQLDPK